MSLIPKNKNNVSLAELIFKLPDVVKDMPKILTALYYNYTVSPNTYIAFTDLFLNTVKKYPHNKCIYYQDISWSYKEFNSWINRLAQHFLSIGFKKGDVAAIMVENRPEILAVSMALSKIGCIAALINTSQKNQPLLHSFLLANPKLILIGEECLEEFSVIQKDISISSNQIFTLKHKSFSNKNNLFQTFDIDSDLFPSHEPKLDFKLKANDTCLYIYTSGTTGLPKASKITNIRWIKAYSAFGLTGIRLKDNDILYTPLPFFHGTAMLVCWASVIAGGAAIVLKNKFSVTDFWKDINYYQATGFGYVGEMCKYLLNAPTHHLETDNTLTKMIGNGLRPEIWQNFKSRFGITQIAEFYASSEGNIAFFNLFNIDSTMGFTITKYAIVEYDQELDSPIFDKKGFMKKVKSNGIGLLLGEISDRYPFDGYTEQKNTEKSIYKNVFKNGDAWFNTGDLVRDMGFFHTQFVDRLGDSFRWKSENVSTTEVEGIINQYEGVIESIVYGVIVPNTNGRAGMANIKIEEEEFNPKDFYNFISKEVATYAVPVFLRLSTETDATSTFKYIKNHLKSEGYNPNIVKDKMYVLINKVYTQLDEAIYLQIESGEIKL